MRLIDVDNLFNNQILVVSNSDSLEAIKKIMDIIKEAPTIDAEPVRHGKWIEINTESGIFLDVDEVKCSECGFVEYFNKGWARFKYCPTCGAKMDEVNDE